MSKKRRPADTNRAARQIVDILTGEIEDPIAPPSDEVKAAAAVLGRLGGLKGGKARAAKLTPKQRSEIGKKAAAKRWGKKK